MTRSTLPCGPLEYITRQTQGDFTLQDQRDDDLWIEAGMVTTQADWSLDFDIGMSFHAMARAGAVGAQDGGV